MQFRNAPAYIVRSLATEFGYVSRLETPAAQFQLQPEQWGLRDTMNYPPFHAANAASLDTVADNIYANYNDECSFGNSLNSGLLDSNWDPIENLEMTKETSETQYLDEQVAKGAKKKGRLLP